LAPPLFQASLEYVGVTLKRRLHKFNIQALDFGGLIWQIVLNSVTRTADFHP
jgi:hypothetical protein